MAKYYILPKFAVEAGPYIGFLVSAEENAVVYYSGGSPVVGNLKRQTSSVDFGVGAGASFNLNNGFFIGARYSLGISKIGKGYTEQKGAIEVKTDAPELKNNVIQVSVGYKF